MRSHLRTAGLAGLSAVAALTFAAPAIADADPGTPATSASPGDVHTLAVNYSNYYPFQVYSSRQCIEVTARSKKLGAQVQQWSCNGGANQRWDIFEVGRTGNGFPIVKVRNVNSQRCWNVKGRSTAPRARVIQWRCNNNSATKWIMSLSGGGFKFRNQHSHLCADVQGNNNRQGANLIQHYCHNGDNQVFG